jgi:hypothetical protein
MMESPSDPQPEESRISRPLPCPGCGSTKGSARVGTFRSQCLNCNGLFPNGDFGLDNQDPQ